MRTILALSVIVAVAMFANAGESDNELATARARAAVAIEIAKTIEAPAESKELLVAKLDAAEAIELAKEELTRPEKAPTPKKLPEGEPAKLPPIPNPVAGASYEWRGDRWVQIGAGGCYVDKYGRKVCPNAK